MTVDTTLLACNWLAMKICVLDSKQIKSRQISSLKKKKKYQQENENSLVSLQRLPEIPQWLKAARYPFCCELHSVALFLAHPAAPAIPSQPLSAAKSPSLPFTLPVHPSEGQASHLKGIGINTDSGKAECFCQEQKKKKKKRWPSVLHFIIINFSLLLLCLGICALKLKPVVNLNYWKIIQTGAGTVQVWNTYHFSCLCCLCTSCFLS